MPGDRSASGEAGRTLVVIAGKDPTVELGGHSAFLRSTGRAAARLGFTPHIFCAARQSGETTTEFGVLHRIRSPLGSFTQKTVPVHAPMIAAAVTRFLSGRPGPHLIHSFNLWGYAGVMASRRLRRRGQRVTTIVNAYTTMDHEVAGKLRGVRWSHGMGPSLRCRLEYAWFKLIGRCERRTYRESDLVLVNYESVRRLLAEKYGAGLPVRKLAYAPESAFLPAFTTEPPPSEGLAALAPRDAPLIVSASRHDPRKGLDILLRALAELRRTGARFRACILSGGPLFAAHRRLARQLRLDDTTLLTNWVPDTGPYLRAADIFVLPSLQEGSGSVAMLEALQAGNAVVASNVDGIPEDVTDGESALLVEPGRGDRLGEALARLLGDGGLRQRLARRAREVFADRFSAPAFTEALRATYAELGFSP